MAKPLPFRIFGIRHHGPGSARRLISGLDEWQPDFILLEAPTDVQTELVQIQTLALEPPVALVVYNEKDIRQALYYPFASFSPEWQAIRWAQLNTIPFAAFDLPVQLQLPFSKNKQLQIETASPVAITKDPLLEIARLAGFRDTEQWWDTTLEKSLDDLHLFDAVNELILELRKNHPERDTPETLVREAYMRKTLRKVIKSGYQKIAVVCGAWHGPALSEIIHYPSVKDNQRLRGLAKTRVKAAWIPWSYPRLAKQGGYGAGISSPAWYDLLFDYGSKATNHWMVKAAQLLREAELDVSPAHAQEAIKLAKNLAYMNDQPIPGLQDMEDAALSILCQGNQIQLDLIASQIILGDKVGSVPENASVVPLQKDLQVKLKSSRLSKYWGVIGTQWLKATKANKFGFIDLREKIDLQKSEVLHQLIILDIPWGNRQEANQRNLGAFKEVWQLEWKPEFGLSIIEAAMWGNTLKEAATKRILDKQEEEKLNTLSYKVLLGLRAGLGRAVQPLISLLKNRATVTRDGHELLLGLSGIVRIIQYGDARKTDVTILELLVQQLVPRLAINLPALFLSIDDELAEDLKKDLLHTHRSLLLLDENLVDTHWWPAISALANTDTVHPLIAGLAVRLLFDQHKMNLEDTERAMFFALSKNTEPNAIGQWLSGFLHGSGMLLLHHHNLWALVNNWVKSLTWGDLNAILPLLRRIFSSFSKSERRQILQMAKTDRTKSSISSPSKAPLPVNLTSTVRQKAILEGVNNWIQSETEG